jgi:hypothetical protein
VTEDLYKRVEKYYLPEKTIISQDGEVVRVKDIVFLTIEGKNTVAVAVNDKKYNLVQNLNYFEKDFYGYFLRVHRSFLVAFDRVKVVYERYPKEEEPESVTKGGVADECELVMRGTETRIPVTNTYSGVLKKALGVTSLHHLVPEHPDDKKLRLLGIIDFAWRELYRLDPKDTEAVNAYTAAWRIMRFGKERTLRYFRRFGENQIDKRRLSKNIIWQVWRWIKKGIRKQFDGNIRSFWYEVKNALGGDEILDADDVGMFYDTLREMIEDERLFRYKDFGFMDMNSSFHGIGKQRPEIILAVEKAGLSNMARALALEVGSSYICTRGEPAVLTIEYFTDNLKAAIGGREVTVFAMTDLNPSGVSIRNSLISGIEAQGVKVARMVPMLDTKDFPDDVLPGSKAKVVRYEVKGSVITPVPPAKMGQVTKALKWFESIGDPRLKTEVEYPGGKRVVTIWGIDSDTADREMVRKRFLEGVGSVPSKIRKGKR